MCSLSAAVSAAVVLCIGATSYADLVYATGTPSFAAVTDTGASMAASNLGGIAGAPGDGQQALITGIDSNGGSNNDVFKLTFALTPGPTDGSFKIFTGTNASSAWNGITLDLTNVAWTGGSSPGNQTIGAGVVSLNSPNHTYTVTGIGWSSDFTGVVLTFTSTQGTNKTASFDALGVSSVPEPGSVALFGIGAAALVVVARRKRTGARRVTA